jgi:molybdenum cofactor synthesis domain-containing protein
LEQNEDDHVHYHGVDKAEEHLSYETALEKLLAAIVPVMGEFVGAEASLGRIAFRDIVSRVGIPKLPRSTRDGYAVKITSEAPTGSRFRISGEARIGKIPKLVVAGGTAVKVATGSFLPRGANAVVMKEYANLQGQTIEISKSILVHDNIMESGEDFQKGTVLLKRGTRIHPQHLGLLSMVGEKKVNVFKRPKVAVLSTGDELFDSSSSAKQNKVYDATRPFVKSMLAEIGADVVDLGIAKDAERDIRSKIASGLRCDALILSAGSSVGERDFVSSVVGSFKNVKVLLHGVAMRPSSPTGLATFGGKPFILLPGFPTSAFVSFFVLARPAILKLAGSSNVHYPMIKARLLDSYSGNAGLTHFLRIQVSRNGEEYEARIIKPTEAQYSGWLRSANGIAIISPGRGTVDAGEKVDLFLIAEI